MTKQVVALEARLDSGPAEGSVKSLKAQLREAQAEVATMSEKFGLTSKQAQDAAKKAAQLKDAIGDAKGLTDAFNPDAKFKAFGNALQGVVGGFAALQGAQALFGTQSKELEETLVKVQSAMALSQGLNALGEAGDAFKVLGSKAIQAFEKIRVAIGSTGIGVLLVALGAVAANWDKITSAISRTNDKQKALNDTFDEYQKAAAETITKTDDVRISFEMARNGVISKEEALQKYNETLGDAFGSAKSLNEAEKLFAAKTDAYIKATSLRAQADALLQKAAENKASLIAAQETKTQLVQQKAGKEYIKLVDDNIEQINKNSAVYENAAKELLQQSAELQKDNGIKTDFEIKNDKKRTESNKKAADEIIEANKQQNELQRQLRQKNYLDSIKDADFRAKEELRINFENKKKEIEDSKASTKEKNESIVLLEKEYNIAKQKLDEDAVNRINENRIAQDKATEELILKNRLQNILDTEFKVQQEIEINRQNELDANLEKLNQKLIDEQKYNENKALINANYDQQQLDATDKINFERKQKNEKAAEEEKKLAENVAKAKVQFLSDVANATGALSDIIGKETAVGKGLAAAQATINTYQGATEVLRAKSILPEPLGTISKVVNVATIIATGLKSVKGILSTKVPGSSGGGGGSIGGVSSSIQSPNIISPIAPQLSNTILNQQAINQTGNAAIRTYVVESDVAGNQERIERLNRAARIN